MILHDSGSARNWRQTALVNSVISASDLLTKFGDRSKRSCRLAGSGRAAGLKAPAWMRTFVLRTRGGLETPLLRELARLAVRGAAAGAGTVLV